MFSPQIQPTDELRKKQTTLYIVFGIGLILLFARFFISINLAINDLLIYLLFWCGIAFYNYCMLAFFVIMTLFSLLNYISFIGTLVQIKILTSQFETGSSLPPAFVFGVLGLTIVYDIVACWFCYDAYKAFKYEMFKGMGAVGGQGLQMESNRNVDPEAGDQFKAFKGSGVKIGK